MATLNEIKAFFDILCKTNLTEEDDLSEISSEEKVNIIKVIDNAKAETERLHILDIMKRVCK